MLKTPSSASQVEPTTIFPLADDLIYKDSKATFKGELPETSQLWAMPLTDTEDGQPIGVALGFQGVCSAVLEFDTALSLAQWLRDAMQTKGGAPC